MVQRLSTRSKRSGTHGFTLVELMVVVAIAGVLATVGMVAMSRHIASSRSIEVMNMIQSIRGAQEQYRSMTGIYLDVSVDGGFYPREPTATDGDEKVRFFQPADGDAPVDNDRWLRLAPTVSGPVQFGYMTRAGLPGATIPELQEEIDGLTFPTPTEQWYTIEASGNVDSDLISSYYFATSYNGEVFSKNAGE